MTSKTGKGWYLIPANEFVTVYDGDDNDTGKKVPKHWGPDQLPAGYTTTRPAKGEAAKPAAGNAKKGGAVKA